MSTGTVKWFSAFKHYGFIAPDEGERDVFVHRSALAAANVESLDDGTRVSFDLVVEKGRPAAVNLVVLETRSSE